ncbi:hypothetical protein SGODD07_00973 [Streptococcus gordonii]|uniref:Uncharacterized protein n=1 Tax=Streptococcus gordonii TaxID=1302 RepID=A0A139N7G1_STRGN|nr:hypothetical protein SGODD07_00973 [Streptococcus gordonii]
MNGRFIDFTVLAKHIFTSFLENYKVKIIWSKIVKLYNLIISVFSIFARIKSQNQYLFFKLFGFVKQISLKNHKILNFY